AALMSMVNDFTAQGANKADMQALLLLLSPFAPHIAEEIWEQLGFDGMACVHPWPVWKEEMLAEESVQMAVQIKGKFRGTVEVPVDSDEATVLEAAKALDKVARQLEGMEIFKVILVKNKLINLLIRPK
ncbi:MAG: class I tRNA ligase family protein, partial [Oscillospiraceae bacterium]|nr:class I tRNA ligase family protein [Oscillospiraceae bacterium]